MDRCDVAVIGISGRFPEISHLSELDKIFANKIDCVTAFKDERRDLLKLSKDVKYFDLACLENIQYFDYDFFGISRQEAKNMDPQQKMILELSYEAIENAGYSADEMRGTLTSVVVGAHNSHLYDEYITDNSGVAFLGNFLDTVAGRVSYVLDLHGEAAIVETACSSSLYAIYKSCVMLSAGVTDMALAGGISMDFRAKKQDYAITDNLGLISPGARCNAFDECADGINIGEGAGMVLLKRYDDAIRDHDPIYAVIKGAAANQDGGRSNSITAPSSVAQAEAIVTAINRAGISAEDIGYIEAHGTGTKIGDPIEIEGITKAFSKFTSRKQFCPVGSLKTNFSHLGSAAGIASFLKGIISFENNKKYPLRKLKNKNPLIDFENSPVYPITETEEWKSDNPRYIGISGFGASGTNVHIILQDCKKEHYNKQKEYEYFLTISGDREEAVDEYCSKLLNDIDKYPVGDIAYTLNKGRNDFKYRTSVCIHNSDELRAFLEGKKKIYKAKESEVIFIISGDTTFTETEIETMSKQNRFFKFEYDEMCKTSGYEFSEFEKNFIVEVAILKAYYSMGINPSKIISAGRGKYVADFYSGKITFEQAIKAVNNSDFSKTDFAAFKKYISGIIKNSHSHIIMLELGKNGRLSECIFNDKAFSAVDVIYAVDEKCSLYSSLCDLYNIGIKFNWNEFYKNTQYARVHISTYPFAKTYSWPDIHEKISESKNKETECVSMSENEIRDILYAIWKDETEEDDFDNDDSFFDLGANSVSAMDASDVIAEKTGIDINFSDIYKYPSINTLTDYILLQMNGKLKKKETEIIQEDDKSVSYNQRRMLYLADNTSDSSIYNMPVFHKIYGKFDADIFMKSIEIIVKRHNILHTVYFRKDDDYGQKILESYDFHNEYIDMNGDTDEKIIDVIENYDFDINLFSEIPIKSVIIKATDEKYFWAVNLHHIAGDGYSYGVFASEVIDIYDNLLKKSNYSPTPLKFQYSDYIRGERKFLNGERAEKQHDFWKNELDGFSGILNFPTDKERPSYITYNGDTYDFIISEDIFSKVSEFAKKNELTPFMIFETAYAFTLAKYTGDYDICVGIPFANRNSPEYRELIGFFVNTLIVRNRIDKDISVKNYFRKAKDLFRDIYANAELPFEEAINGLKFKRKSSYLPLIQFMFAYQNFKETTLSNGSFTMEADNIKTYKSKFEMTLTLAEHNGRLIGNVEYNTDLYYLDTIIDFIDKFLNIVCEIINNSEKTIEDICFNLDIL